MKKTLSLLSLLLTSSIIFGQIEFHKEGLPVGNTMAIDSATSSIQYFGLGHNSADKVYVVNTQATIQSITYQRIRRIHQTGWSDQICNCEACFQLADESTWTSSFEVDIAAGDSCLFEPKVIPNGIDGCAKYTYIINYNNGSTFGDSLQVTYTIAGENCFLSENEIETSLDLSVYPNPANDELNISISENNTSISIFDIVGKNVSEMNLVNGNNTLNIENLNAGVYFYSIKRNGNVIETKKLVVR